MATAELKATPIEAALAAIDKAVEDSSRDVLAATLRGLMIGYDRQWGNSPWKAVEVEQSFHLPIINPETGRDLKIFTHSGRTDGIVEYDDRVYLLEHKTASEDVSDPSAPYWRRLAIDAQVSGYVLANWQCGRKLDGTLYDVIRKPSIRPKKIAAKDAQIVVKTQQYCGYDVSPATVNGIIDGSITEENGELYELRLVADISERPDWYFQRRSIPRMDAELVEYAQELCDTAREIRDAQLKHRHYRNPNACMMYNSPCEYLGLCSGHDVPESDNWRKRQSGHVDVEGDPLKILSHSRMSTFRTCRRKHFYRYELGIEPNKEEKEALYFGKLFHEALAAWWFPNQLEAQ